eukprot:TRINITY_DN553_c0_g1_i8.p1 TRINITY_DN553_c0_g1~~TRINITY_DN553_c0_g1_i8.p1  ORF type:complete len:223 (-),score=8.17 TRINITY_DN553_c0_g1_i8:238-906(-)
MKHLFLAVMSVIYVIEASGRASEDNNRLSRNRLLLQVENPLNSSYELRLYTVGCDSSREDCSDKETDIALPTTSQPASHPVSQPASQVVEVVFSGEREDSVSHGRMFTTFTLYSDGSIRGSTRTWSEDKFSGFTGSAFVVFLNDNLEQVWHTDMLKYGVNGKWIPGAPSDRTELWTQQMPRELVDSITQYSIMQQHASSQRFADFMDENQDLILSIATSVLL